MKQYNALVTEKLRLISDIQKLMLQIDEVKKSNQDTSPYVLQLKELRIKLENIDQQIASRSKALG